MLKSATQTTQSPIAPGKVVAADFPILQTKVHDKTLVYLDSAATSQKPQVVLDAIQRYYTTANANVHRGVHTLGDRSTQAWHQARKTIATFLGAAADELVVTRNATEALNWAAQAAAERVQADDIILVTQLEHHSNLVPWQRLAEKKLAHLVVIPTLPTGFLDVAWLRQKLADLAWAKKVKVLATSHVSNAIGTVLPLEALQTLKQQFFPQAWWVVDGAQGAPHLAVHFDAWPEITMYAVSAHKMLGPMGVGALLVKHSVLENLSPWLTGGGMIDAVTVANATFHSDLEERFSAGTPDVAGLVGWAAACDYLETIGLTQLAAHDEMLVAETLERLDQFPKITVVGPKQTRIDGQLVRCGSVTFIYQGVHAHDVGQILDSEGVAVRSGHHCTMPLHQAYGWTATVRASFQCYTSSDDIARLQVGLQKVAQVFA